MNGGGSNGSPVVDQDFIVVYVNGRRYQLRETEIQPEWSLLHFIRQYCGLTGTKLVCGEGGCGACTVLLSKRHASTGVIQHSSVNACLYPLAAADGAHVITVEGIGSPKIGLHPIQIRLAEMNASQCGFCTPGIVMAFYALVRNNPSPTAAEIEHVMDGNLCRCTGYRPILDATKSFAADRDAPCAMGANCCRNGGGGGCGGGFAAPAENKPQSTCNGTCSNGSSSSTKDNDGLSIVRSCTCSKIRELAKDTPPTPLPQAFREDTALIFPPALTKYSNESKHRRIVLKRPDCVWIKPHNLSDLVELKSVYPDAKLVCGNTEAGVDARFRQDYRPWKTMIYCSDIAELQMINEVDDKGIDIGASVTINQLALYLKERLNAGLYTDASTRIAKSILSQIHWFAGTQIRNVATLAGNMCTASPISDLNPVWQAVDGVIIRLRKAARAEDRLVPGAAFFVGYRKTCMEEQEVLVSMYVPLEKKLQNGHKKMNGVDVAAGHANGVEVPSSPSSKLTFTHAFKQSRRRADDIAIVTCCHQISLRVVENDASSLVFDRVGLSYGGMAPCTKLAVTTAASLIGKPFSLQTLDDVLPTLSKDFPLLDAEVLPGGMGEYRMTLAASFLTKMFYHIWHELKTNKEYAHVSNLVEEFPPEAELTARVEHERGLSSGMQTYQTRRVVEDVDPRAPEEPKEGEDRIALTQAQKAAASMNRKTLVGDFSSTHPAKSGEAIRHLSALQQASGEAKYCDDVALVRGEVYAALVTSTEAHARIVNIDTSALEADERYLGFWSAKDIPGNNDIGDIVHDEELFATKEVVCVGTLIGITLGRTQIEAMQLAKLVKVEYEKLPTILTIDEAIAANSFIAPWEQGHIIESGDVDAAMQASKHVLEGEGRCGGQEHFYLESMSMIVTPGENDTIHVTGTTQNLSKTQQYIARVLGIPASKVVASTKRIGGGFGGKETRALHLMTAVALAAHKHGSTVRMVLDRDLDMCITGQRHAFLGQYKVGFDDSGKIHAMDTRLYANGGCSADLTMPVVDRAILHVDNAYNCGAVRIRGYPCKTNLPSNTAFRGFGGPQGMFIAECMIEAIAHKLKMKPEEVRRVNLYKEGDRVPCGQLLEEYTVPQQFQHLNEQVQFEKKRQEIAAFNAKSLHIKRGMCVIPTKFGLSFTAKFLNQAGALVLVYSDGSVMINHGGVEMGQGLGSKMCQVVAAAFGIPLSLVSASDTSTDKVANTSPTAASASSDLNGAALMDACTQILKRLEPIRAKHPDKSWKELVSLAYYERISLCASGYYATPGVGYDFDTHTGKPFNYFTTGVAYSEVEVDTLTGDFTVLESHIVMDVGVPINPVIDIGQIEGAFIQGMGMFTMEELVWGDSAHQWVRPGQLQTRGPGSYKIPTANDIPLKLHVELWKEGKNSKAIFSSKGVGEPPLFMSASVFFAIRDALHSRRLQTLGEEEAYSLPFILNAPATSERIRMAAADPITAKFMKASAGKDAQKTFQTLGSY